MLKKLFATVCLMLTTSVSFANEGFDSEQLTEIEVPVSDLIGSMCLEDYDECDTLEARIIKGLVDRKNDPVTDFGQEELRGAGAIAKEIAKDVFKAVVIEGAKEVIKEMDKEAKEQVEKGATRDEYLLGAP